MKVKYILFCFFFVVMNFTAKSEVKVLEFAVGHDHEKMLKSNYPIYRANWAFITQSLGELGYKVAPVVLPWARAIHSAQTGKVHGLFLAANFEGRDQWAELSSPLGKGFFGGFYHVERYDEKSVIAGVRLSDHDKVMSSYEPYEVLDVATAQSGLKLLYNKKVDRFVMSESYGNYLLSTELVRYNKTIKFDQSLVESRTVHIAFAKNNERTLKALAVVNEAIALGIKNGFYEEAMIESNVPKKMWLPATR